MKPKIIFFGNGPLASYALSVLEPNTTILFHAKTPDDLETAKAFKAKHPDAFGILASFGVFLQPDFLQLFEPTGILNLHPSLLPQYRGPSPIETAILSGDTDFSFSIMKLVPQMDAGPVFYQSTLKNLPLNKDQIYRALAEAGANWLVKNLQNLPTPTPQDESSATYTQKLDKNQSYLTPETDTAAQTFRKIVAFQDFPKPKYAFFGHNCVILEAHPLNQGEAALLPLPCADGQILSIDRLQPENKRPMDAKSFLNGYAKLKAARD